MTAYGDFLMSAVNPRAIGRLVDVSGDLERVRVRLDGRLVAEHARVWARNTTLSDQVHVQRAALLRQDFQRPRVNQADDLVRDLFDYDRAFGLTGEA